MGKDPAFLFYPNDFLGGTMGMSFEDKGAYLELLILQFNRGHMSIHMIQNTIGKLWENIRDKFKQDNQGLYYNKRADEVFSKRRAYSESRRNNRLSKKEDNQINNISKTHHNDMENGNENINSSKNEGESEGDDKLGLIHDIVDFFGFSASNNPEKLKTVKSFYSSLEKQQKVEYFKSHYHSYKLYKESSKEKSHGFKGFLGSKDKNYLDGGWNQENWKLKLENFNKNEKKINVNPYKINAGIKSKSNRLNFNHETT